MSATKRSGARIQRLTGRVKEKFGVATGNLRLRDEGRADQFGAHARSGGEREEGVPPAVVVAARRQPTPTRERSMPWVYRD